MLRRLRAERAEPPAAADLAEAPVVAVREHVAAVRVHSPLYGDVWICLEPALLEGLREEADRLPVLTVADVERLRGKPEAAIRAALATLTLFTGSRVLQ
jgi:hypothetical protein